MGSISNKRGPILIDHRNSSVAGYLHTPPMRFRDLWIYRALIGQYDRCTTFTYKNHIDSRIAFEAQ